MTAIAQNFKIKFPSIGEISTPLIGIFDLLTPSGFLNSILKLTIVQADANND